VIVRKKDWFIGIDIFHDETKSSCLHAVMGGTDASTKRPVPALGAGVGALGAGIEHTREVLGSKLGRGRKVYGIGPDYECHGLSYGRYARVDAHGYDNVFVSGYYNWHYELSVVSVFCYQEETSGRNVFDTEMSSVIGHCDFIVDRNCRVFDRESVVI